MAGRKQRIKRLYDRLSYNLIEVIERLQSTPGLPSLTELAEETGMHVSTLWRRIKTLQEYNVEFSADVNYSALGFRRIVLVTRKSIPVELASNDYLEYFAPLIPRGSLLQFLASPTLTDYLIEAVRNEIDPSIVDKLAIYGFHYNPKPNLRVFYDMAKKEITPNWGHVFDMVKLASSYRINAYSRKAKYDEIDLFILEQLIRDPFLSMREITKMLQEAVSRREWRVKPPYSSVTYSRVRRHFLNHIIGRNIVSGIYVKTVPFSEDEGIELAIFYKAPTRYPHLIASTFSEHPYTLYSMVSLDEREGMIRIVVPGRDVRGLIVLMETFEREGFIEEWNAYVVDRYNALTRRVSFKYFL